MSIRLEQLLRDADESAAAPHSRIADMGQSVRALARSRRRRVRLAGGFAAVLVVMLSVIYVSRPEAPVPVVRRVEAPRSPTEMRRALASLDAEAQASMALVERLVAAEERRGAARRARVPDPLVVVRREQDRAAHLLVFEADRLAKQLNETERAAAEYRRVVSLFPDTRGAAVARERLAEMGGSSERRDKAAPHFIVVPGTTKELS